MVCNSSAVSGAEFRHSQAAFERGQLIVVPGTVMFYAFIRHACIAKRLCC